MEMFEGVKILQRFIIANLEHIISCICVLTRTRCC